MAIIAAYSAVFHAARAVLFMDGIGERSHLAIYTYLKAKHPQLGLEEVETFNQYRSLHHAVAYGLETEMMESDARDALRWAEDFIRAIRSYLKL